MNKSKKNINNKEKENIFGGMTPKSHDLQKHIVLDFSAPIITEVFMGFDITNKEYDEKVKKISPNSRIFVDMLLAFLIGGAICAVGQVILDFIKNAGIDKETASGMTSVVMIFIGSFLTAINVYGDIAEYGGAGTLVPITGFANGIVSSAMEFKSEGYIMGMGSKMFTIAGPVLVFGSIASFVCGVLYYLYLLIF